MAFGATLLLVGACGARTGLVVSEESSESDASVDAGPDAGVDREAPPDHGSSDSAPADTNRPDVPVTGCTSDSQCSDGIYCTIDRCDLATGTCTHDPDNARCEPGFQCKPPAGCVATSFANSASALYGVALPAGSIGEISPTNITFDDIALRADGTLFAVSEALGLFTVDLKTGAQTSVAPLAQPFNALDFGPDGTLYGAGTSSGVYTIDPTSGNLAQIATLPMGYESSGDLAVIGTTLLISLADLEDPEDMEDSLGAIDLESLTVTIVGKTGFLHIYGLASYGTQLFGFTSEGQVIQIDPTTASSTLLADFGPMYYGASAR
jgi:hypothetical protein